MPALDFEHLAEMGGNEILHHEHAHISPFVVWLPTALSLLGIGIAGYVYYGNRIDVGKYIKKENPIYRLVRSKYYIDYIYKDLIAEKFMMTLMTFWDAFDIYVIDGVVNGISTLIIRTGGILRKVQTGIVQNYALVMVLGLALILLLLRLRGGG
jgi:NADH-quinone oxidoreductase subunit L